MSQSLTFNDVTLTPVSHQNRLWIRAVELARALGYKDESSVRKIYERNSDEFTPDMTQVIEVAEGVNLTSSKNLVTKSRIFSPRGCHLISMFARTSVAKAFRHWVLDVLDKLNEERQPDALAPESGLSPAQRAELKAIVDAKLSTWPASVQGKARAEIWTRFNRHFRIAEYAQLPAEMMPEARDLLIEMRVRALAALPPTETVAELPPAPAPVERPLIYRDGKFYPPHRNRKHVAGPREKAAFDFWRGEFGKLEHELDEKFRTLLDGINRAAGNDLYSYAVAAIGREADTMFSISCLLEGLYLALDKARASFKEAMELAGLHMRLSAEIAVALNR